MLQFHNVRDKTKGVDLFYSLIFKNKTTSNNLSLLQLSL